jgi:elongation factor Ts
MCARCRHPIYAEFSSKQTGDGQPRSSVQVAANPEVQFVSVDDIPQSVKDAEYAIESGKEDLKNKPEAQIPRIVEGRVNKTMTKMCLMDQEYIRDTNKTVDVLIKEAIAKTGENVKVRRFTRFNLGEGIEKKQEDFAAEVAAQTGQA